jgi:hypothetical protein
MRVDPRIDSTSAGRDDIYGTLDREPAAAGQRLVMRAMESGRERRPQSR